MKFNYRIEGMHCKTCVEKIKSSLSLQFKKIEVTLDPPILQVDSKNPPLLKKLNEYLSAAGKYQVQPISDENVGEKSVHVDEETPGEVNTYYPIFLIAIYILGATAINNIHGTNINWHGWMNQFMAGFFLVFSAFKFLDIRGFAEGYATYDLLARRWYSYGFIYPFLELGLGILYLGMWFPAMTSLLTMIIMGFSSLGVINSLLKRQKIRCACLGTLLKVPLSTVTLVEDIMMVILAAVALVMA